ncbi:transcriptional regulator [Polaromonas sp. CG_9.5]|uniref:transcriptional regulator n=1 Tax=Polaromonas sp. CG_9.5 TaxID=3071705 RepID=UPI002E12F9DF
MELKKWVKLKHGRAKALAIFLKVPPSFVSKIVNGDKPVPFEHMAPIEAFTDRQVTRKEMLPNSWQVVWPELAQAQATPAQPAIETVAQAQAALHEATVEIKQAAEELRKKDAPWDGVTERRKLNAPIDRLGFALPAVLVKGV